MRSRINRSTAIRRLEIPEAHFDHLVLTGVIEVEASTKRPYEDSVEAYAKYALRVRRGLEKDISQPDARPGFVLPKPKRVRLPKEDTSCPLLYVGKRVSSGEAARQLGVDVKYISVLKKSGHLKSAGRGWVEAASLDAYSRERENRYYRQTRGFGRPTSARLNHHFIAT